MRHFQRVTLDQAARLTLPPSTGREVERHMHATVSVVLERELRSRDFLDEVSRRRPAAGAASVLR
jgi:hypothetical protein